MSNPIKLFNLYFNTLRYLTFRQVYYQVIYKIKRFLRTKPPINIKVQVQTLKLLPSICVRKSYSGHLDFEFLNLQHSFERKIDWDFDKYEKLWCYNLNYFDFLHQEGMNQKEAIILLDSFCEAPVRTGVEPYPISLRGINWIKYFIYNNIENANYDALLFSHFTYLSNNLEYHLMGNHLLENAFSLFFASYYFDHRRFYEIAKRVLKNELKEQILVDGAHFELSTMYHQILLFRLLDCINLAKNNSVWRDDELFLLLEDTAQRMTAWLRAITFENGDVPMVNDAAWGIAPGTNELVAYATSLGLDHSVAILSDSGYRMLRKPIYELFVDIGNIGPDYIPGHAHSDTFSFILYVRGKPIIVDTGTSTYSLSDRRILERSTCSHNTVVVHGCEQSEVWASFRVGRRAKIISLKEASNKISAIHNGYDFLGIRHKRTWHYDEGEIKIYDEVIESKSTSESLFSIHFHGNYTPTIENNSVNVGPLLINCKGDHRIEIENYQYATGFNRYQDAKNLKLFFRGRLETSIKIITDKA
jgi:hypothetical protein